MGEDFEGSVDTSSFDDISTDTTDTSSFSDPVDVGDMMDDIPTEPLESFDVEPLDNSFETELPTAEATDIDSLMDGAADTYTTEEASSDTLDSSGLDPSDISSDIGDYEMDAGSDIADLMDEAAIESFDEVAMDTTKVNDSTDNDIETLMNDVELVSDTAENPSEIEMDTIENDDDNINEVESLLATEELSQDDASDLVEELDSDNTEEMQEATDVSALMDESDVGDTIPLVDESIEDTSDDFETEDVPPVETDMEENEIGTEEISEGTEPLDSTQIDADTETNSSVTDISEDEQGELEGALSDVSDTQPGSPLDAEVSAYDQLADYYNSHNYGQQDYAEYSKDPEWQELNNAYLQELGREPIDYSGDKTSDISDIHDELIAADIPEGSSELDAILANEQAGIDMSNNSKTEGNIIEEDINDLLSREPLEQSDSDVYKAKPNSEIPIIQEDGTVDTLENIMNRVDQDTPKEHLDVEPYKAIPLSDTTVVQEDGAVDSLESLMDQEEQEMNNGSYDSAPEALSSEELPNQSRIDELKAEKEELLSLKEQLLEYQQEHPKEIDQDEGAIVRVLKKDGSDTSVVHHDYEAELADLDKGITKWQKVQEEWAAGLNEELKQINENPNLSEAERAELIKDNYAKRDLFSQNYDKEFAELQAAREELAGKVSSSQLDATNAVQEIDVTDVPKLEDVSDWINDINPNYDPFDWQSPYSNNCGSCAFAVEQRLDGSTDISATSENIGTIEEMNKITGMEQVAMSPDEIKDYLVSQGPGSHGIVGIDRVSGQGHWFNAYYDGEKVVAIDGQTGEINDWPPDYGDVANWDISVRKEEA